MGGRAGETTLAKVAATRETSADSRTVATKTASAKAADPAAKGAANPNGSGKAGKAPTSPKSSKVTAAKPLPTLRIVETRVLRGPNYWSRQPVVKMLVDLGVLEQFPSNKIPGFVEGLLGWMPSLEDHACSLNRRGGFVTRLKDGTWAGHIAEHIALELQNLAGTQVHHGKTRSAGETGQYNVIYEYREEAVGIEAGKVAVRLVNHLVAPRDPEQAFDYVAELEALILLAERQAFGPSTQAILDEAASRDIPFLRLDRASLVQLGQGVHQQRIRATMTSRTSAIGVDIASRQEPHQPPPRLGRPAGPEVRGRALRRRRGRGSPPDRLPGGRQAARRQPRPRRPAEPPNRRRHPRRPSRARAARAAPATSSSRRSSPATTTAAS